MAAMDVEALRKLESYCDAFYSGAQVSNTDAHETLLRIADDPASIPQLQAILANSQSPYALIFAASGLLKLFTSAWNRIPNQQKDDIRKFLFNKLFDQGPQMLATNPPLLQSLVRLLCRVVKLGWLDSVRNQNITEQVGHFLRASTPHWIVALTIYTVLTEDMHPQGRAHLSRFRRTAMSFRETALSEIFRLAIQTLLQINVGAMPFNSPEDECRLLKELLRLCVNCLSFDFTVTMVDETNDDQPAVMIPYSWSVLREEKVPELFFSFYKKCWATAATSRLNWSDVAVYCLQSLVLLSAIRRSFFQTEEERRVHMSQLINGTRDIMQNRIGLSDEKCFHEFCRLLGKINTANQLAELAKTAGFKVWIELLFQLTMENLSNWQKPSNSQHYLVGVWSSMTAPLRLMKTAAPTYLVEYVDKISLAYIDSRLKIPEALALMREQDVEPDFEDYLSNEVLRAEQLSMMSAMGFFNYHGVQQHLVQLFKENQAALQENRTSSDVFQQRAAWLIYFMGSLIEGVDADGLIPNDSGLSWVRERNTDSLSAAQEQQARIEDRDRAGTEMSQLVFELMRQTDALPTTLDELELAYLFFLEQFRKGYVSTVRTYIRLMKPEEAPRSGATGMGEDWDPYFKLKVTDPPCLGMSSHSEVFNIIAEKLFRNLQIRVDSSVVLKQTLAVLRESSAGCVIFSTSRGYSEIYYYGESLRKCGIVQEVLKDHRNADRLAFLRYPKCAKLRTRYCSALTQLAVLNENQGEKGAFLAFLNQFNATFSQLMEAASAGETLFATPETRQLMIYLARDFRGVAGATCGQCYHILFNWLVNNPKVFGASRFDVFVRAVGVWSTDHEVMLPLLKCVGLLVENVPDQEGFGNNSPNGIYLAKTTMNLFQEYGTRILAQTHLADPYNQKYKGIAWALHMLNEVMAGKFVNFGTFEAYNDSVVSDVIILALQLCLSIPLDDLRSYPQALSFYFGFLARVTEKFMHYVIQLEPEGFRRMLESTEEVCGFDMTIVRGAGTTIANVVEYFIEHKDQQDATGEMVRLRLESCKDVLIRLLNIIFQYIVSEGYLDAPVAALFVLIIMFEDEFEKIKEHFILQQVPERRQKLKWHFDDLMTNVTLNTSAPNKDVFQSNLYAFASVVRSFT